MQIFLILLALAPLCAGALTVEDLAKEIQRLDSLVVKRDTEIAQHRREIDRLNKVIRNLQVPLNDTSDLEARVTVLEETVSDLEADMEHAETDNTLQDQRLNILEIEINDNENDIEALVGDVDAVEDSVSGLTLQVTDLEDRVGVLESGGGGGNANITDLEIRVDSLEEMTSQLSDDVTALTVNDVTQDERLSSVEEEIAALEVDVASLNQRVGDLESTGGGANNSVVGDTVFLAALNSDISGVQDPLVFDRAEINPGGQYSTSTGKYTVPYDGVYQFFVNVQWNGFVAIDIEVDDYWIGQHNDLYTPSTQYYRSFTFIQELAAGQTVHVVIDSSSSGAVGHLDYLESYFGGYMIVAN